MKKKNSNGKITISRVSSNDGDFISVEITDYLSGCRFVTAEMSVEDFGRAITGHGFVDCSFELAAKNVGLKREVKTVNVESEWSSSHDPEKAKQILSKHETDGWIGRLDDMFNHHNRTKTGYNVTFIRFVKP